MTAPSASRPAILRKATGPAATSDFAGAVNAGLGDALPQELQQRFERSLGVDLSGVRLHTGADSAAAAESLGARAFAVGNDVHFAAGAFDPQSNDGQLLIAHEVAHTVQQQGGAVAAQYKLEVSEPGDPLEREADQAMTAMVAGAPAQVSGGAGARISRWANAGAARPLLELIAHGDRTRLQAIILALETARAEQVASGVPAQVSVPGLWQGMIDARDLYPLEVEARRRFAEQHQEREEEGGGEVMASGIFDRFRRGGRPQQPPSPAQVLSEPQASFESFQSAVQSIEARTQAAVANLERNIEAYNAAQRAYWPQRSQVSAEVLAAVDNTRARIHAGDLEAVLADAERARGGGLLRRTAAQQVSSQLGSAQSSLQGTLPGARGGDPHAQAQNMQAEIPALEARLEAAIARLRAEIAVARRAFSVAQGGVPVDLAALRAGGSGGGPGGSGGAPPAGPGEQPPPGGAAPPRAGNAAPPTAEGSPPPAVEGAPPPVEGAPPSRSTPPAVEEPPAAPRSASGRVSVTGPGRFSGGLNTALGVLSVVGVFLQAMEMSRPHYDMYMLPAGTRVWGLQGLIFRTRVEGTIVIEGTRHYVRWDNGQTTEIEPEHGGGDLA